MLLKKKHSVITSCLWRSPDGQRLKMMKNKHYDGGRLQCLCNEVDLCYFRLQPNVYHDASVWFSDLS